MSGFRVAVLVSGAGTNLQAILDRLDDRDGIDIAAVVSNRPQAKALERARNAGVETAVFPRSEHPDREARDAAIGDWLAQRDTTVTTSGASRTLQTCTPKHPSALRICSTPP